MKSAEMTHWERVRAVLRRDVVDRPPISAWRHFYRQENSPHGLAQAMLDFQRRYDWDFMKVNPRASYYSEDWGVRMRYSRSDFQAPRVIDWPIKSAGDWRRIEPLDIHQGVLGEQLQALSIVSEALDGKLPFIMTLFTPLSIAGQLAGSEMAMKMELREHPDEVHEALHVITESCIQFAKKCVMTGASGLFFDTTRWSSYDLLDDEQYADFGRAYDLPLLKAVPNAEFHLLHICGSNNMLTSLADYPVAAFNWDAQDETNLWLKEGEKITGKTVVGGIPHRQLLEEGSAEQLEEEVLWTLDAMDSSSWMVGPGCTVSSKTPAGHLRVLRGVLDGARTTPPTQ